MLYAKDIQSIIPHRYPFLLIDRAEIIEPGKKAEGYKNLTINEQFFQGHFPEEPVMPGVLIIEAMAQLGAVAVLSLDEYKGRTAYFGGINKARFRRKVVPGDVLKMEVEIVKMRSGIGIGAAKAMVEGEVAAEAELVFAIK